MLFHITHVHTPETCPYNDPEKAKATFGKMIGSAESLGVTLHGAWVDAPAHTVFLVAETDSSDKHEELLAPGLEIGVAETHVVQDGRAMLERRTG